MKTTRQNFFRYAPRMSAMPGMSPRPAFRRAFAAPRVAFTQFFIGCAALYVVANGAAFGAESQAARAADIRQGILDCTFEVLAQMRGSGVADAAGSVAPLVRVAGTASCFGEGELATAAHVFDQVLGSRFEAPVVRDRRGRVYPIERILRYSMRDDFVVFSVAGLRGLPAREHNVTSEMNDRLHIAWRRSDRDIAFGTAQYRGRSTVEELGRDGWVKFGPAPGHGASGAALYDGSGHVVGLINSRSSEAPDAHAFAVPIQVVEAASTEWADIALRDPMRTLGMGSERNMPLLGGIPLPAPYERFERHMVEIRKTYFAHTLPYSLSLDGVDAPMSDVARVGLCDALEAGYCAEANDAGITRVRASGRDGDAPRGCEVTWNAVGASLVRCRAGTGIIATRMFDSGRAHLMPVSLGRRVTQAPPAPCTNVDPLEDVASSESFADHTGAKWQVRVWPVRGCDWVVVAMSRSVADGTLTFVRGAASAYADAAGMQLKALTAVGCAECAERGSKETVLAEVRDVQNELSR